MKNTYSKNWFGMFLQTDFDERRPESAISPRMQMVFEKR